MQTYNDDVDTDMQNVVSLISMKDKVLNMCVCVCVFSASLWIQESVDLPYGRCLGQVQIKACKENLSAEIEKENYFIPLENNQPLTFK